MVISASVIKEIIKEKIETAEKEYSMKAGISAQGNWMVLNKSVENMDDIMKLPDTWFTDLARKYNITGMSGLDFACFVNNAINLEEVEGLSNIWID